MDIRTHYPPSITHAGGVRPGDRVQHPQNRPGRYRTVQALVSDGRDVTLIFGPRTRATYGHYYHVKIRRARVHTNPEPTQN